MRLAIVLADGEKSFDEAHDHRFVRGRILVRLRPEHLQRGVDQEHAKDVQDPVVARYELRSDADHRAPHGKGTQNPPEQHPMLKPRRNTQVLEDDRDDEHVVSAE